MDMDMLVSIADSLARIATALESRGTSRKQGKSSGARRDKDAEEWVRRVVAGDTVAAIAESIRRHPSVVRRRALNVFRYRNLMKYVQLRKKKGYGEPSMRLLVEHSKEFGF